MPDLKPCPFCGCTKNDDSFSLSINRDKYSVWVDCENCGTCGPDAKTEKQAINAWNRRANDANL